MDQAWRQPRAPEERAESTELVAVGGVTVVLRMIVLSTTDDSPFFPLRENWSIHVIR